MKDYLDKNLPWNIQEENFHKENNLITESVLSQGNGHMGLRGNFEEDYSGESLQGSYLAGVYYPDKTRVGWWKNGYPEYFAKVLNSINWIGIHIKLEGELLDLNLCDIQYFRRDLNMKNGILSREVRATSPKGVDFSIYAERFVSMERLELGTVKYRLQIHKPNVLVELSSYLDGNVHNQDSNYQEYFWEQMGENIETSGADLCLKTKKTAFICQSAMKSRLCLAGEEIQPKDLIKEPGKVGFFYQVNLLEGQELELFKTASTVTSRDYPQAELLTKSQLVVEQAMDAGWDVLKEEQQHWWDRKWQEMDIVIDGELQAQQGIRFNIFQLNQTYHGHDARLNIGPKGFTGEKYGGTTYWDTEAYCLPFYLSTAQSDIAKNLLIYRYKQLDKAIENAEKLGFKNGAALYPMVTMNGEECHNEWEITFEEIHRNGAIAYAVWNYINYTNDWNYLMEGGLEVLIAIARFWTQRVNWSQDKNAYVILGVTGPNEYENNVNNNWYTNLMAQWCLDYCSEALKWARENQNDALQDILSKTGFTAAEEEKQQKIARQIFLPEDKERGIYLQQEGYLDKELIPVNQLSKEDRPLNQNWSWDRILRSCYIKQADVLQGLFFFEDDYDLDTIQRNFDFYEPLTVHESSLSPCVYSILANKIGNMEKAYQLYLRTARLDLDDYNNDTEDGCHSTSMAGTWMSVVYGFGGFRVRQGMIHLDPRLPRQWNSLTFSILFRDRRIEVSIDSTKVKLILKSGDPLIVVIKGNEMELKGRIETRL